MNTLESVPGGRDPVALAIEKYLRMVEKEGVHKLSIKERAFGVRVRFAGQAAETTDLDAALIRLGDLLSNHVAFQEVLRRILYGTTTTGGSFGDGASRRIQAASV